MRVPTTDAPRRTIGARVWLIVAAVLLLLFITSLRGIARFYTDYLWFQEVGFGATWRSLLGAKIVPAVIFTVFFFVIALVNLYIADRIAPKSRAMGTEDEIIEKYRTYVAPYAGRLRVGVAAFFALVMGVGVSAQWRNWILFSNSVPFHIKDPQFHKDIGFYVFRLPFLEFAVGWLFAALLVVLILTAVFHYVNGGIRLQSPFQRVTPQVKVHLSVILALMALTKTVQYYLARYELLFSHRGVVDGAGYTDVKAQLPALNLLMIISVAAAVLFIANIFRRGWVFPIIAVGLWGFISIVVGTIYPAYIQRIQVQPNEFAREEPYIKRNITATRAAFGLDNITTVNYPYAENLDSSDITDSKQTLDNARLWDQDEFETNLNANQGFQPYLTFVDVDLDRYQSGVDSVPALISARELNPAQLPSRTWTNTHLVYTHGYAAVIGAGNAIGAKGAPSYLVQDIPPTGNPTITQSGVYYGQNISGFAVVHTKVQEIEPAAGSSATAGGSATATQKTVEYSGTGGVAVSSFVRRAALALRFGSWDLFVSGQLTKSSRVIFNRDILDRVRTAAPFLRYDADPYPVVTQHDGKIYWVIDAYTTTNRYPYSQSIHPQSVPDSSGLNTDFNYVRNSVKAVVDAYNGSIKFYVVDKTDPIINAYEHAFPGLFTTSSAPADLVAHWRYPEDIFSAQTEQYNLYHMTDAQQFYGKTDIWDISPEPSAQGGAAAVTPSTTVGGNNGGRNSTLSATSNPIVPIYQMMHLPNGAPNNNGQEFVLTRSFVPRGKPNILTAFIVGRSDGANYGKLVVYNTPQNSSAPSPLRAANLIESNPEISRQFSLLDQRGSQVLRGEVQLLPMRDSVVYVRPIWVQGEVSQSFPVFNYVAMTYGDSSVLAPDVETGIADLLHTRPPTTPTTPTTPTSPTTPTTPTGPVNATVASLLQQAQAQYNLAQQALKTQGAAGFGAYQAHLTLMQTLINEAIAALNKPAPTTPTTPTTKPATTTTTKAPAATTTVPPTSG